MSSTLFVDAIEPNLSSGVHIPGHVVQFLHDESFTTVTITTNVGTGWIDLPVSITVTPKNATSKIYVRLDMVAGNRTAGLGIDLRILRDTTILQHRTNTSHRSDANVSGPNTKSITFAYVDTPSSTSQHTYKIQCAFRNTNSGTFVVNDGVSGTAGASNGGTTLTLMEIAQ